MAVAPARTPHTEFPSRRTLRLRAQEASTNSSHVQASNASDDTNSATFFGPVATSRVVIDDGDVSEESQLRADGTALPPTSVSCPPPGRLGAAVASTKAARPAKAVLKALSVVGATGLLMTFALPGVAVVHDDHAPANIGQQRLLLGALSESSLEALATVSTEQIEAPTAGSALASLPDASVQFPIADNVHLTDGFGYRTAPIAQFHNAQDFAAPEGTPVMAISSGTVTHVGYTNDGLGFNVTIEHTIDGKSVTSQYAHMQVDSAPVAVGQSVNAGDRIGNVGNTGFSFGAHLHLVIKVEDEPVDPMVFIPQFSKAAPTGYP